MGRIGRRRLLALLGLELGVIAIAKGAELVHLLDSLGGRLMDGNARRLITGSAAPAALFLDGFAEDICGAVGANYGEPTALSADDDSQIDLWFTYINHPAYCYSLNGLTFQGWTDTDVPAGNLRPHILKDDGTYYLYVTGASDTSAHLFTGSDKVHFADQGEVLGLGGAGQWDDAHLGNTFIWREGATWYMLYEASGGANPWYIGLATASAPGGPWTRYVSNPVIVGTGNGVGNPELPRLGSTVIQSAGRYYQYFHGECVGGAGPVNRAYSVDLHTWTHEGAIDGIRVLHGAGYSYGDHCLCQFQGKTYLFWSPSDQVSEAHMDVAVDNRTLAELLALPPAM